MTFLSSGTSHVTDSELLAKTAAFVWENSPETSGIRKWVVAMLMRDYSYDLDKLKCEAENLPNNLLMRLLVREYEKSAEKCRNGRKKYEGESENDDFDYKDDGNPMILDLAAAFTTTGLTFPTVIDLGL